jgi:formylglycine-generating enzyme required for sulfatase activity
MTCIGLNARGLVLLSVYYAVSAPGLFSQEPMTLSVPASPSAFSADQGCQWVMGHPTLDKLRHNAHYLAGPAPQQAWSQWLDDMREYRQTLRQQLHDPRLKQIDCSFDGVRAYVRTSPEWALAADLKPGERIEFRGQVRWIEGGNRLCAALDWCDRSRGAAGTWRGWSEIVASTSFRKDGQWHEFCIPLDVPKFSTDLCWAKPILGMDGTFDDAKASYQLRQVSLKIPGSESRSQRWQKLTPVDAAPVAYDDSVYERPDLAWMSGNFVCGFVFIYDRAFWDPERRTYRVEELCDEAEREFGGYDSIVLWQAYPRIGADDRNQFDFFRDMPGGLGGVRDVIERFQRRGVRVFLPYNPWDTGTRREGESDEAVLAELVAKVKADGIFLDTLTAAPTTLRDSVDALRPGVVFAPEIHPLLEELEHCNGSWAQWLQAFPEIGVLHLKWIEPRHMQHQIRRWDKSHQQELAAAWLNGSGIFVWENVFGSWNPWNGEDRATLRRMVPVLRHFASHFSEGEWLPYFPTLVEKVHSSYWERDEVRLWTIVNQGEALSTAPVLEVDDRNEKFFDLWSGEPIEPKRLGSKLQLTVPLRRFGTIVALPVAEAAGVAELVEQQRLEAKRTFQRGVPESAIATSVLEPRTPPRCPAADPHVTQGMLPIEGGEYPFVLRHMRRECGCYPDGEMPPDEAWSRFLSGNPHSGTIEHRITREVSSCRIDRKPVTNGQFAAFLEATDYSPTTQQNFLRHWGSTVCPEELADEPVVYVDLEDARAYAAWARKRLPTEWEWHRAAQIHGQRFQHEFVYEWTESERDDGHNRFVTLRGGCRHKAEGSVWYFPGGPQPVESHAKFLLLDSGLDRCATIGFRCVSPAP